MTRVLNTREKQFRFDNEFENYNVDNSHYIVNIIVKDLKYEDGNQYYDISYNFYFVKSEKNSINEQNNFKKLSHPFNLNPYIDSFQEYEGDIIVKNEMTDIMIEYLLMDDDKLSKFTGHTTTQKYRQNIMWSLCMFWD